MIDWRRALQWLGSASALAGAAAAAPAAFVQATARPLYRNTAAPIDLRVKDLIGRMTLDDKVEVVEPGRFDIMVVPNSRDLQTAVLEIA